MLYMYSLEPPIYYFLNKASRNMDRSKLDTLGPYASVLAAILACESDDKRDDAMKKGKDDGFNGPIGYFS